MQIRSRIVTTLAPAAALVVAAMGVTTLGAASAGAATAGPPLPASQIEMGTSGKCVTAADLTPGAAVILATCSKTNKRQRWVIGGDGTIQLAGSLALLSANPATDLVVLGGANPDSQWFPQADKTLVNIGLSPDPQHQMVLGSLASGTQLHVLARTKTAISTGRERYLIPHTIYASSSLTNRPDSGGGGDTWALDTMTRQSSVTRLSDGSYEASIVDDGGFVTVFGNLTPNQGLDSGKTLGDDSLGQIAGHWGFIFTASTAPAASRMPAKVNGVGTVSSGNWYKLFFAASTTFGGAGAVSSGPLDWSWSYSLKDNCGTTETWLDADNDNSGQRATPPHATDITAPGPGDCS